MRHSWDDSHEWFLLTGLLERSLARRFLPVNSVERSLNGFRAAINHVTARLRSDCSSMMTDDRLAELRESLATVNLHKETVSAFIDRL